MQHAGLRSKRPRCMFGPTCARPKPGQRSSTGCVNVWLNRQQPPASRWPLLGVPFAVKDNIDMAGEPTTAACPAFATIAGRSASVVHKLLEAGAVWVGKTNLDQFATGLVGTRSPYGRPASVADPARISGGSSSGSALAVALGIVPFALGTDTAGSGRIPAAFNGIVGLKPTPGRVSTAGVLPACRTLDCVSVFATSVDDAAHVLSVIEGPDPGRRPQLLRTGTGTAAARAAHRHPEVTAARRIDRLPRCLARPATGGA